MRDFKWVQDMSNGAELARVHADLSVDTGSFTTSGSVDSSYSSASSTVCPSFGNLYMKVDWRIYSRIGTLILYTGMEGECLIRWGLTMETWIHLRPQCRLWYTDLDYNQWKSLCKKLEVWILCHQSHLQRTTLLIILLCPYQQLSQILALLWFGCIFMGSSSLY